VKRKTKNLELLSEAYKHRVLNKISRAFYVTPAVPSIQAFYLVIKKFYQRAVISKRTLLYYYKLTTDQPLAIDVGINTDSKLRNSPDLINVYRTNKIFNATTLQINSVKLIGYSIERALFEVLHFEKKSEQLTYEVIHKRRNTKMERRL